MAQNRKGLLPKVEMLIIAALFVAALVIILKKCESNSQRFTQTQEEDLQTAAAVDTSIQDTSANVAAPKPKEDLFKMWEYSRLFITIDGLNLRKTPDLNGDLIVKLPLFEEVFFLNEVTDSTYQINLGYEVAEEPWVKIRTKKGHEGWVYGAGVHYYKKKRAGVLE